MTRRKSDIAPTQETATLDEVVKSHISNAPDQCQGRIEGEKGTAKLMNINPSTLRKKMRKLDISRKTI